VRTYNRTANSIHCLSVVRIHVAHAMDLVIGRSGVPRNSEVLPGLSRIPMSVEYTSVTTESEYGVHSKPRTRGLPPPDPRSLCPLSLTEFVEPPSRKKILGTPLTGRHLRYVRLTLLTHRATTNIAQRRMLLIVIHATHEDSNLQSYVPQDSFR
jgi:hypothetical protein